MRAKLLIEYDGTDYAGWQAQKNAKTVAGEILRVAGKIFPGAPLELYGAGRTDAGVHARGQVAHLDIPDTLSPETLCARMNDFLPTDIHILRLEPADARFHARHHASLRHYVYQISKRRDALDRRYVWWVKETLDVARMRAAARGLVGFHDFVSFSDEKESVPAGKSATPTEKNAVGDRPGEAPLRDQGRPGEKSTWVKLERLELVESGDRILVEIAGSHFLRKMVRRLVGNLVEVGKGKLPPETLARYLKTVSREPAAFTAPPQGLFLSKVDY